MIMRSAIIQGALLCALVVPSHARVRDVAPRPMPPGLQVVLASGAGRVVVVTCADVKEAVGLVGAAKAEQLARTAGATDKQIAVARRCLK